MPMQNQKLDFLFIISTQMVAVNPYNEPFRYRISEEKYTFDRIDGSATIGRADGTFGFSLIQYDPNFDLFKENALTEIERIQSTTGILHEHLKMIT
jgi:chloramphenicol O-acetyltransferase type A